MSDDAKVEAASEASEPSTEGAENKEPPSRIQQMMLEYGVIGIIVLLSFSALSFLGFALAFLIGFDVDIDTASEDKGMLGAAMAAGFAGWLFTKPVRIPVAIALTPLVAAGWKRLRGKKDDATDGESDRDDAEA